MRLPDWRDRLNAEIRSADRRRFVLGQYDCVHFVARCVDAMTGSRWIDTLPRYRNAFGAWKALLAERGFARAVTRRLGAPLETVRADCGDVVIVRECGRRICGICLEDDRVAVPDFFAGLIHLPHSKIIAEWSV